MRNGTTFDPNQSRPRVLHVNHAWLNANNTEKDNIKCHEIFDISLKYKF